MGTYADAVSQILMQMSLEQVNVTKDTWATHLY